MPKYSHNYTYLHVYTVWPTTIPIHHPGFRARPPHHRRARRRPGGPGTRRRTPRRCSCSGSCGRRPPSAPSRSAGPSRRGCSRPSGSAGTGRRSRRSPWPCSCWFQTAQSGRPRALGGQSRSQAVPPDPRQSPSGPWRLHMRDGFFRRIQDSPLKCRDSSRRSASFFKTFFKKVANFKTFWEFCSHHRGGHGTL